MKGFIVYSCYRLSDDKSKAFIYLFGRLENGESFLTISEYKPYFFIKTIDAERAKTLVKAEFEDTAKVNFKGEKLTKTTFKVPTEIKENRDLLESHKVKTYESDVLFVMRFFIDHEITSFMDIEGDFKKGNLVNRIYESPSLKGITIESAEELPKLKILSIDLESSMDNYGANDGQLYSISMYTEGYEHVFLVNQKKYNNATSFPDEMSLLEAFKKKVIELDPDIITGWNVIDFDLDYLKKKFDKYGLSFAFGRTEWQNKLRIESSFFKDSKAEVPGRQVLDGIHLLKSSFVKLPDYRLDTAASVILGEKKLIGHENKGEAIEDAYKNDTQKLVDYNLSDSKLAYDILAKKKLIELTMLRSSLTGMSLDRVSASVASLDSLYLRMLKKNNIVANYIGSYDEEEERAAGGFVMESVPGIHEFVVVLDFKSLYPSVMRTFNIDPYSLVETPPSILDKDRYIKAENGAVFKNADGFLPQIIERIWRQRDLAKKRKDDIASYALKILMNSLYGAIGNPGCRYHNLSISNAITHTCQKMIKLCAKKVEEKGYKVIYGDTDSIFILSKVHDPEEAEKLGEDLAEEMNIFFTQNILDEYHRKSYLELEFDKVFSKFMMPKTRTGTASKKRYAGLLLEDGKEKIDITGMEFVRGDWCEAAKEFQYKLLDLIFHGKEDEVKKYIKDYVKDIKAGKLDEKLVIRKSIRKELVEYTKTTPPHVKAARKLKSVTSSVIEYYMAADGEPYPKELMSGRKIDYDYYLEKQIKPLADTVLSFYGQTFDDLMKGHTQKGLDGFF
jgi:DNA polymerase-2